MKKTMMLVLALLCGAVSPSAFGAVRGESAVMAIDTVTIKGKPFEGGKIPSITWNAAWVGGNTGATVVIKDNGTEVKRATGTGQFTWTPSTVGAHTLTYTTYINGIAQAEVYSVTVYSEWKYTVSGGKATITATAHTTGNVAIPGTLNGYTVTGIGDNAFKDCHDLERVTIPSTVTRIGANAFRSCDYLDNVVIQDSVTEIGDSAFYGCSYIQNLSIGTGVKTVGDYAFYGCSSLQRVSFPGNALTSIGSYAFSGDWRMVSVNLPGSVTSIGSYAFSGCSGLTEVGVPSRWTMQSLFPDAYAKLESVAVPAGPTSVVDGMFSGCTALETVTLPSGITSIGANAFKNCTSLTTLGVPASVTSIGSAAFSGSSVSAVYYLCQQAPSCASDAFTSALADLTHFVLEGSKGWDGVATSRVLPQKWQGRAIEHFKQSDCAYSITVRFYAGGGSGSMANVNVNADLCANDTRYTLPACRFTRSGFAFAGWRVNDYCFSYENVSLMPVLPAGYPYGPLCGNLDLTAMWTQTGSGGGSGGGTGGGGSGGGSYIDSDYLIYSVPTYGGIGSAYKGCTYNGYALDDGGMVAGTFSLAVKKPAKGKTSAAATLTFISLANGKKTKITGNVNLSTGAGSGGLAGLYLGAKCVGGRVAKAGILDGGADAAKAKDAAALSVLSKFSGKAYVVAFGPEDPDGYAQGGYSTLSISMAAKGKAKVSGVLADGTKVTASGMMTVGDTYCCVPVIYSKKSRFGFVAWFDRNTRGLVDITALTPWKNTVKPAFTMDWAISAAGAKGNVAAGKRSVWIDADATPELAKLRGFVPGAIAQTPYQVPFTVKGTAWTAEKAAKVAYKGGAVTVTGANVSGMKLTYTAKTGLFKGAFTVYAVKGGKLVKNKFSVFGAVTDGAGWGTAVLKGKGSVTVYVE